MKAEYEIVGIGEILWDLLPEGKQIGGAPANFAYISQKLGNRGNVASRIGDDDDFGREILQTLEESDVNISHIQKDAAYPTGTVKVSIESGQPSYEITETVAWDFLELSEDWRNLAKTCDAVCFGTLAQRNEISRKTIQEFLRSTRENALRIFDVNLRQNYFSPEILRESLSSANIAKFNHEELPIIANMFEILGKDQSELAENLRRKFNLKLICVTRGANGSLLIAENETSDFEGFEIKIRNTIGAGDAFMAAMAHGILRGGWRLNKINEFADKIGSFVASQTGAMPNFPKDVLIDV